MGFSPAVSRSSRSCIPWLWQKTCFLGKNEDVKPTIELDKAVKALNLNNRTPHPAVCICSATEHGIHEPIRGHVLWSGLEAGKTGPAINAWECFKERVIGRAVSSWQCYRAGHVFAVAVLARKMLPLMLKQVGRPPTTLACCPAIESHIVRAERFCFFRIFSWAKSSAAVAAQPQPLAPSACSKPDASNGKPAAHWRTGTKKRAASRHKYLPMTMGALASFMARMRNIWQRASSPFCAHPKPLSQLALGWALVPTGANGQGLQM